MTQNLERAPSTLSESFQNAADRLDVFVHQPLAPLTSRGIHHIEDLFTKGGDVEAELNTRIRRIQKSLTLDKVDLEDGPILTIQYRALNYLYGSQERTTDERMGSNPLRDILLLLASPGTNSPGTEYRFAIPGPPIRHVILGDDDASVMSRQYAFSDNDLRERTTFRTIARFAKKQRTIVRGLYVMARVTDRFPEVLKTTLEEYVRDFTQETGTTTGVAMGLLEMLNNLHLLGEKRFSQFAWALRDLVMDDVRTFERLKENWYYHITHNEPFWLEGETLYEQRTGLLHTQRYHGREGSTHEQVPLPEPRSWDEEVRGRAADVKTLAKLTKHRAIAETLAQGQTSLALLTQNVRDMLRTKSELEVSVRLRNRHLPARLEETWRPWLAAFSPTRKLAGSDYAAIGEAVREVMTYFSHDTSLSMKTRSLSASQTHPYAYNVRELAQDPLFTWMFSLTDASKTDALEQSVRQNPAAFSLLMRLMVHTVAHTYYRNREADFLLDPQWRNKADSASLIGLLHKIRDIVNLGKPPVRELVRQTLGEGIHTAVGDLVSKKRTKNIERQLHELHYAHPLPLISVDKSYSVTRRTFLKLMLVGGFGVAYGSILGVLIGSNSHEDERIPENTPENAATALANAMRRMPDRISRAELGKLAPFFYGSVLQLPKKYFSGAFGERIGYFPVTRTLEDSPARNPLLVPFDAVYQVENIAEVSLNLLPDQLAIRVSAVASEIYPPLGWKPAMIIQEAGATPTVGSLGELYFDPNWQGSPPENAIIVYEKLPSSEFVDISERIVYGQGQSSISVGYHFSPLIADSVNQRLSRDRELQSLHTWSIHAVEHAAMDDTEAISRVATDITKKFEKYTLKNRFYALGFTLPPDASDYAILQAIADRTNEGYYCTVAAIAYRQFMASLGFFVVDQPGYYLRSYDNQLWGRVSHRNSVLLLPNGHPLYVDMTPPATSETPYADTAALAVKEPSAWELLKHRNWQEILATARMNGVRATVVGGLLYGAYRWLGETNYGVAMSYVENALARLKPFTDLEKEVVAAAMNRLAYLPYDTAFYDEANVVLTHLNGFRAVEDAPAVVWLLESHPLLLHSDDAQGAFRELLEFYREKPHILRVLIPGMDKNPPDSTEMPESFPAIHALARLVNISRFETFKQDIYERLHIEGGTERARREARFKAHDVLSMVKARLFDDAFKRKTVIRGENAPYFQALHDALVAFTAPEE